MAFLENTRYSVCKAKKNGECDNIHLGDYSPKHYFDNYTVKYIS